MMQKTIRVSAVHLLYRVVFVCLLVSLTANTGFGDEVSYSVVHGWPDLPPGRILGEATGVAVDSHNHVFVFHRAGREWSEPFPEDAIGTPTIAVFDGETGQLVSEWGADFFVMPHGLSIDQDDHVWVTDVARHQVFKFTHDGELRLTLGEDRIPGDDMGHFNLPTDVAVDKTGVFFVSDGYGNTRVLRFSPDGQYQMHWGVKGSAEGEFDLPHGIAVDDVGRVYVADRSNARIQVFDRQGRYLTQWKGPDIGRPYAVEVGGNDKAYVVDGGDQPEAPPDRSRAMRLSLSGAVEATFGRYGNYDGQFMIGHDIAVGGDDAVYVVDVEGKRVQKFVLN